MVVVVAASCTFSVARSADETTDSVMGDLLSDLD